MTRKCAVVISAKHLQRVAMKGFVEIKVLIDLNGFSQNRETACTVMQKKKTCCFAICVASEWMDKPLVETKLNITT